MKHSRFLNCKVFTGNSNRKLAEDIVNILELPLGNMDVRSFSDGEVSIQVQETVRGVDVFVIQSTCAPVNQNLMELLAIIDAMKRASAARINAVIPYYGYARQDRTAKGREPITARLVADILTTAGADRVICMDLHAAQIQGFFNIPVDHLMGGPILTKYFQERAIEDLVVVSPDHGSAVRARNMATPLGVPIAIIDKRRPAPNVCEVCSIIGDIQGKNCVLIDDMVDTAGSLCKAAEALVNMGAKKVYAAATHGILSGPAIERINASPIEEMILLDTIPLDPTRSCPKIRQISVAPLFAEAIHLIHAEECMSQIL